VCDILINFTSQVLKKLAAFQTFVDNMKQLSLQITTNLCSHILTNDFGDIYYSKSLN